MPSEILINFFIHIFMHYCIEMYIFASILGDLSNNSTIKMFTKLCY